MKPPKSKCRLWAGLYKGTDEIATTIFHRKDTAKASLGPHMKVIEVEIRPVRSKRKLS